MPNSIQLYNFTLITGSAPATGQSIIWDHTLNNSIFYGMSGLSANSTATLYIDVADPLGNFGYTLDSISLSGSGLQTNIATFSTPLTQVRGIISGCSGVSNCWIYGDSSY